MNSSNILWWDDLDGDTLACRPGIGNDEGFGLACLIVCRIMPAVIMPAGIILLYVAFLQVKLAKEIHRSSAKHVMDKEVQRSKYIQVRPQKKKSHRSRAVSSRRPPESKGLKSQIRGRPRAKSIPKQARFLGLVRSIFGKKVVTMNHSGVSERRPSRGFDAPQIATPLAVKRMIEASAKSNRGAIVVATLATATISTMSMLLIHGQGSMYASNTLRGKVGDLFCVLQNGAFWYLSLLQVRGARWFKDLVQAPGQDSSIKPEPRRFNLPSSTVVLDKIQGRLGLLLPLTFWLLFLGGVYSRAWYHAICQSLTASFGFRAFVAISTQRVSALKKVELMQTVARGSVEIKNRRSNILKAKKRALVVDLAGVFFMTVVTPGSTVVLGSTFSSRQFVIHYAVLSPVLCLGVWVLCIVGVLNLTKARRRRFATSFKHARPEKAKLPTKKGPARIHPEK